MHKPLESPMFVSYENPPILICRVQRLGSQQYHTPRVAGSKYSWIKNAQSNIVLAETNGRFAGMRKFGNVIVVLAFCSVVLSQQRAPAIEPRILSFEAKPATIRPGESVQLIWQTEATRALTIEPQVGPVAIRGTRQVSPTQTTTYTLRASDTVTKTVTVTVAGTPVKPAANAASTTDAKGRM